MQDQPDCSELQALIEKYEACEGYKICAEIAEFGRGYRIFTGNYHALRHFLLRASFVKGQIPLKHHHLVYICRQNGLRIPAPMPRGATFRPARGFPKHALREKVRVFGSKKGIAMTHAREMIETNPNQVSLDTDALVECIEACFDCAQTCTACADACLGEQDIEMLIRCIHLDLDCADMCNATGKVLSRQTAFDSEMARAALEACARACRLCGEECEGHAEHMEHCRVCAEACRRCQSACNNVLSAMRA
jgi:hypothetical protein